MFAQTPEYGICFLAQDSILHFVVSEIEIRESSAETLNKTVQNTIRVEFGLAISSLCKSVHTTTGIYFDTPYDAPLFKVVVL